ncbi:hypothetical protein TSUD_98150 [Trifolium subterraneum]|uniref:Reverse transcriptase Ty1/copia-type domain-containing protein n=1 Tax=Trifolium subterraneum TaxID=3900 RepID=A0A2Z6N1S1_TRISU|nr:hypothetical protein TSUD_98150 [Trifolium subterraneum]
MEDQTIEDIDKVEKTTPKKDVSLSNIDPVRLSVHNLDTIGGDVQNGEPHEYVDDQQLGEEVYIPADNDEENDMSQDENLGEPEYFQEAMESDENQKWLDAMNDEMKSLHDNHTYDLVKLPKGKRALENRWIYRVKHESNSESPRYKARLVVKGFRQRKGVDFNEIFSHVVKMSSIRTEEIYMKQPDGFQVKGKEDYVCRLRKSLYGLKQAPRQWYKKFESVMSEQGYKTTSDHFVFVRKFSNDDFIILLLYVDDMLIVGKNISNIDRKEKKLWMSQEHYIKRVLQRFQMENSKAVSTPLATHFKLSSKQSPSSEDETLDMKRVPYASVVGSLMYAMMCTRPDIAHAVGTVNRFLSNPGREHWNAVKWVLRYLRGTTCMRLCFGGDKPTLEGYSDSDMAGDIDSRKSTSGYMINWLKFGGHIRSFRGYTFTVRIVEISLADDDVAMLSAPFSALEIDEAVATSEGNKSPGPDGTHVDSHSDWFSEGVTKRIGNGTSTSFWFDPWVDGVLLRNRYQSLFQASDQCLDRVADMGSWVTGEWEWDLRWKTDLDMQDQDLLNDLMESLRQDKVPTRQNLRRRRVMVGATDISCVFCGAVEESIDHLFVSCDWISPIWYRVSRWLGIEYVPPNSIMQVFESFFGLGVGSRVQLGLILVWHAVVWTIWTSRNDMIFVGRSSTVDDLMDMVKLSSWKWFIGKNPDSPCSLYEWEVQPILCWSSKTR